MSYAEKKAKREQEIEGLKEALEILSAEALLQVSSACPDPFALGVLLENPI